MAEITVRRVNFGYFVRPAEETGTGGPRVEPCLGYVVGPPQGMILFDTGMGSHPDVDAHYRPRRVELREALAAIGAEISEPVGLDYWIGPALPLRVCNGKTQVSSRIIFPSLTRPSGALYLAVRQGS